MFFRITYSKSPKPIEKFAFVIHSLFAKDELIYMDFTLHCSRIGELYRFISEVFNTDVSAKTVPIINSSDVQIRCLNDRYSITTIDILVS